MKNCIGLFLLLLPKVITYSQGNLFYLPESHGYYHIFGDKVNVREAPDKNSKVLKQLTIGDSVAVIECTQTDMIQDGINYPWVKIVWVQNRSKTYGYVWGGLLSFHKEVFNDEDGREYALYYGPTAYVEGEEYIRGEVRLCHAGSIIQKAPVRLNLPGKNLPRFSMGTYKNEYNQILEFRNIDHIFSLDLTVESCGPSGEIYVLVNDGRIIFSGTELGSFSGGDFAEGNYFVFPWDKGGMKQHIFEYYSYYSAEYEDHPEVDTCYLIQTYTRVGGTFTADH